MTKANVELFPPGEFIRDELDARNWTQEDLAEILGRPLRTVNQIIAGKKAITPQTAQELAAAFETTPELWLNLENAYRLGIERKEQSSVARRARLFEMAPVKDMFKRRWICETRDAQELELAVMKFLELSSLDEHPSLELAATKPTSSTSTSPTQLTWCFRAKHLARTLRVRPYSKARALKMLSDLRALAASASLVQNVSTVLASAGIRFVVIENLPRSRIDGATLWLDDASPVVAMSMRYDRIDGFWHTLAHELSHVIHGDRSIDVDLVGAHRSDISAKPLIEQRADDEASNFLIPSAKLESFIASNKPRFSKAKIMQFANLLQIHPGIVVGQLQLRKAILISQCRELLAPVRNMVTPNALTDGWGHFISF